MPSVAFNVSSLPWQDPIVAATYFAPENGFVFFDSATAPNRFANYSFIGFRPTQIIDHLPPRESIQQSVENPPDVPWVGGWAGFLSYDLCHQFEKLPRPRINDQNYPDILLGYYVHVIAFDHRREKAYFMSHGPGVCAHQTILDEILAIHPPLSAPDFSMPVLADIPEQAYEKLVQRVIDYIYAGDIFQANLTRRFQAKLPSEIHPFDLYRRLRTQNSAPFAGYINQNGMIIASASPERFLKLSNGHVETRPIKGTRRRSSDPQEDHIIQAELANSDKDRAENIMIVDLLRNDLSRVCKPGSVTTPELLSLETYATVHHLVSSVEGELEDGVTALDLIQATFPGGSITGAPKIRAMEIIAELEPNHRGPYCGSMGFINLNGDMDFNILIRTYVIQDNHITFQTGGGIVADSDPHLEYLETEVKAAAMKKCLTGSL